MKVSVRASFSITLFVLSIIYIVFLGFLLFQHSNILSTSIDRMHPTIPKGSLLMLDTVKPKDLQISDIVLFTTEDEQYSIGRIAGIIYESDELAFRTKSDFNPWLDFGFIKGSEIHGLVIHQIPHIGFIADFSNSFSSKLLLVTPLIAMLSILLLLNRHIRTDAMVNHIS